MQDDEADPRARSGRAIRDLGHASVGHEVPVPLLEELTETLADLTARLGELPPRSRDLDGYEERWGEVYPQGRVTRAFGDRPISGQSSPWGLDLDVHRHGDEIDARLTLRDAHEGAPGRSHGGVVAALFHMSGAVLMVATGPNPRIHANRTQAFQALRSTTTPLLARTRSAGAIGNTSCHVPAAAHTSS